MFSHNFGLNYNIQMEFPYILLVINSFKDNGSISHGTFRKSVHLKLTCVQVIVDTKGITAQYRLMTPHNEGLAVVKCDFLEELWDGGKELKLPLINWSGFPVFVKKQSTIWKREPIKLVTQGDSHCMGKALYKSN